MNRTTVMVAQSAERRNVAPEAMGSIPIHHPELQVTGDRLQGTACRNRTDSQAVPCPLPPVPWCSHPGGGTADSPGSDPGGRTALRVRIPPGVLRRMRDVVQPDSRHGASVRVGRLLSPVPCHLSPAVAPVAQRTRAPDYGSGGPRFESWRRHVRWKTGRSSVSAERSLRVREARGSNPRVPTGRMQGGLAERLIARGC